MTNSLIPKSPKLIDKESNNSDKVKNHEIENLLDKWNKEVYGISLGGTRLAGSRESSIQVPRSIQYLRIKFKGNTSILFDINHWNHASVLYAETLGWNFESLSEEEIYLCRILEKSVEELQDTVKNIQELHFSDTFSIIKKYTWLFFHQNKQAIHFLKQQFEEGAVDHAYIIELIKNINVSSVLESLEEIGMEKTIRNIEDYRKTYLIPFGEQIAVNNDNRTYTEWESPVLADKFDEYIKSLSLKNFPFLDNKITEVITNGGYHQYKERVDPSKIIGSVSDRGGNWIDNSISINEGSRDTYLYAKEFLKKCNILESFQVDRVYLTKIRGPDGNCLYIVITNGNHRSAAAKIVGLPYIDACICNLAQKTTYKIRNKKYQHQIEDKIKAGLIRGEINNNTLHTTWTAFDGVVLENTLLKEYITFYENLYPNGFSKYYSILKRLGI